MFELGGFLPYLINRAGVRLAAEFGRELDPHGIVLQEWRVLAALAAHGAQRLSDLATLTSIDLSTLSRQVGHLTRRGLVARKRANGDRRELSIALTARGVRVTAAIIPTARRYERVALKGISPREAARLKRLLMQVYANLDALNGEARS
jgi:DNA-binding MarR family transcriptional regulator